MAKILFAEDDSELRASVDALLRSESYIVEVAVDGEEAQLLLSVYSYDLIILDWQMPKLTGIDVCQWLRSRGIATPVLMLTAKSHVSDKRIGLDTGADDYLTKPFLFEEFLARIRALMRRGGGLTSNTLTGGEVVLDPDKRAASYLGKSLDLLPKEFAILEYLMRHPGQVFSGDALLARVWSSESEASSNTVRTHVYTLRKKLAAAGQEGPIKTVHGVGYKFDPSQT